MEKNDNKELKIKLVFDITFPSSKWLVWERNIAKNNFINIVDFRDVMTLYQKQINRLGSTIGDKSAILPSDCFRKLEIQEYTKLGAALKSANVTYNKKKDIFIRHDQ